jgi:outer membrane protein TolC
VLTTRSWPGGGLWALAGLLLVAGDLGAQSAEPSAYSLREAIAVALENNRSLRDAKLGLEEANEAVREAWGSLFPSIDALVSYTRNLRVQEVFLPAIIFNPEASPDELIPVQFGADNAWSAQLVVTQPLFDAGAFVGVGTAGSFQMLQEEIVRGQAQQAASRVRRAYYTALLAREQSRVIEESVKRTEETLAETRALNRAGLAADYDVLRLEVRLANLRPNLQRAANAEAKAERDLSVEMGLDEVKPIRVVGQLHQLNLAVAEADQGENAELLQLVGYRGALDASLEDLYTLAAMMRSDLRQARLNAALEHARLKYERTTRYPRLSAFFNAGVIAQENGPPSFFGESSNQRSTSAQVGVSLEIPIFQGFQRSSRVQQRELARRQADLLVEQIEHETENQIRTAYEALLEARQRAEAQGGAVSEARRGFDIVTAQYLAGISSQLEVTEGEVLLRESEFNYAQAIYDYLIAQAVLDEAVGIVPLVDEMPAAAGTVNVSE